MKKLLLLLVIIGLSFYVKKKRFVSSDFVGLNYNVPDKLDSNENFYLSSLWGFRSKKCYYNIRSNHYYLNFLLLICGDIESCPGPSNVRSFPELEKLTKMKGLKLFHHNVRGLWVHFHHITELFSSFTNIDILTLSETHTLENEPGELFKINDYTFIK